MIDIANAILLTPNVRHFGPKYHSVRHCKRIIYLVQFIVNTLAGHISIFCSALTNAQTAPRNS
jgi:hypothetical protein